MMSSQYRPVTAAMPSNSPRPTWWDVSEPTRCSCASNLEYLTEDITTPASGPCTTNSSSPRKISASLRSLLSPRECINLRNITSWSIFRPRSPFLSDVGMAPPPRNTSPRATRRFLFRQDVRPSSTNIKSWRTRVSRFLLTLSILNRYGTKLRLQILWILPTSPRTWSS